MSEFLTQHEQNVNVIDMPPIIAAALAFHLIVAMQTPTGGVVLVDAGSFPDKATCLLAEEAFRKPPVPESALGTVCVNLGGKHA